jgi:hypothetical protein
MTGVGGKNTECLVQLQALSEVWHIACQLPRLLFLSTCAAPREDQLLCACNNQTSTCLVAEVLKCGALLASCCDDATQANRLQEEISPNCLWHLMLTAAFDVDTVLAGTFPSLLFSGAGDCTSHMLGPGTGCAEELHGKRHVTAA